VGGQEAEVGRATRGRLTGKEGQPPLLTEKGEQIKKSLGRQDLVNRRKGEVKSKKGGRGLGA